MANKVQNPENDIMVETKGKLETFFDNYGNKLLWALIAVAVAAVAIYLVVSIISSNNEKKENTAQAALTVAITTDAAVEAYVAVVDEYAGTKAANTAAYMAGAEYLEAGDLENAKAYLAKYDMVQDVKPGGTFLLDCAWSVDELDANLPEKVKGYIANNNINITCIFD